MTLVRRIPLRREAGPGGRRGHRHGRRRRRAGAGRRGRGGGHGLRRGHAGRGQGHPRQPGRAGLHRRRHRRVRRPGGRAVVLRRRRRRHARHREDQLHRPPAHDRPLLAGGMLGRGSAIGFISSAAGLGWEANLRRDQGVPGHPRLRSARSAWIEATASADYCPLKQAICAYVAGQAFPLLKQGIRINAICPGPTDTPLAQANKEMWLGFGADYRERGGHRGRHAARAGLPAGVPVQRRGGRDQRDHHDHRRRATSAPGITGSFPPATAIATVLPAVAPPRTATGGAVHAGRSGRRPPPRGC